MRARPNFENIGCYHQFKVESEQWAEEAEQEIKELKEEKESAFESGAGFLEDLKEAEQEIKELKEKYSEFEGSDEYITYLELNEANDELEQEIKELRELASFAKDRLESYKQFILEDDQLRFISNDIYYLDSKLNKH